MSEYLVGCHFEVLYTRDIKNINVEEGLAGLLCGGEGRCLQLIIDDNIDAAKQQAEISLKKLILKTTSGRLKTARIRLCAVLADETDSEKVEGIFARDLPVEEKERLLCLAKKAPIYSEYLFFDDQVVVIEE